MQVYPRWATAVARPFIQLYDIEDDPFELNNISGNEAYSEIIAGLTNKLHEWMVKVDDPLLQGPVASPYYTRAMQNMNTIVEK